MKKRIQSVQSALFIAIIIPLLIAGIIGCQDASVEPSTVTGIWQWSGGGVVRIIYNFKGDGTLQYIDRAGIYEGEYQLRDPTMITTTGDNVTFFLYELSGNTLWLAPYYEYHRNSSEAPNIDQYSFTRVSGLDNVEGTWITRHTASTGVTTEQHYTFFSDGTGSLTDRIISSESNSRSTHFRYTVNNNRMILNYVGGANVPYLFHIVNNKHLILARVYGHTRP